RCLRMTALVGLGEGGGWDGAHGSPDPVTLKILEREIASLRNVRGPTAGGRRNVLRGVGGVKGGGQECPPHTCGLLAPCGA
ncbi:MAG: hypothetical protein WB558_19455, partial [Terriglobales bacterium]